MYKYFLGRSSKWYKNVMIAFLIFYAAKLIAKNEMFVYLTKDILNITAYASENLDTTELSKILKIDKKKLNFYIDFLYQKKILKKF